MNKHIFAYRAKTLIRNKDLMFWTMLFPIVLGTLFKIVFANLEPNERAFPLPVALVARTGQKADQALLQAMGRASMGGLAMFDVRETSLVEARSMLSKGEIIAYIECPLDASALAVTLQSSGLRQSIVKAFLDRFTLVSAQTASVVRYAPEGLGAFTEELESGTEWIERRPLGRAAPDTLLTMYFALMAMASLFGGYFGIHESREIQANQGPRAARLGVSPVPKMRAFLSSASASLMIHFSCQLILLAYLHLALGVDFGDRLGLVALTCLAGSFIGIAIGALVGVAMRGRDSLKEALVTTITMVGSFMAGLMLPAIKFDIAQSMPILAWINPVGLMADAYYALYFNHSLDRYAATITAILGMGVVLSSAVYFLIRKRTYVSL